MASKDRLAISKEGDHLIVRSGDIDIKQAFFSWGSYGTGLSIRETPEFYGRDTETGSPKDADTHVWEWKLSRDSVDILLRWSRAAVADPNHYRMSKIEVEASTEVIGALEKALGENR